MKPYLLVFEIDPLNVGKAYDMLPVHCTLVHWFFIDQANERSMIDSLGGVIKSEDPVVLTAGSEETFTATTNDGPVPVTVNTIDGTRQIATVHERVCAVLEALGVRYSDPAYVHETYVPHVTHQVTGFMAAGETRTSRAIYLVTADAPSYGNCRTAIARFAVKGVE